MPNGKSLIPDIEVLKTFEEEFIINDEARDERLARKFGVSINQVYAILNKRRFCRWIEYGVSLRAGWLTPEGKAELERLRNK